MWGLLLAAFLVGAACGGWFSRRRAVAQSFIAGHAKGEAAAYAYAQGGSVVINEGSYRESDVESYDINSREGLDRLESDLQRRAHELGRHNGSRGYLDDGGRVGDPRAHLVERVNRQVTDHG
jgi:hypothetical protein